MNLLQEILSKHHQSYIHSKDNKGKKIRPIQSGIFGPPQKNIKRGQSGQKGANRREKNSFFKGEVNSTTMDCLLTKKEGQKYIPQPKKNNQLINQYLNSTHSEWPQQQPRKDFSITIYSSKSKEYKSSNSKYVKQVNRQPFQLQVNRFPIMRKKSPKRKQMVDGISQRPFLTPQLQMLIKKTQSPLPLSYKTFDSIEKGVMWGRRQEKEAICAWQDRQQKQ